MDILINSEEIEKMNTSFTLAFFSSYKDSIIELVLSAEADENGEQNGNDEGD